ncbi:MAG: hypothetical protein V3W18_01515 [candidate division Zixibacteria bacterium]
MDKLKEILIEKLSVRKPEGRLEFLIDRINRTIKPPKEATQENVNIRVMYIVNDRVNSHGGRFKRADLLKLCSLIVDTPVLIGHNRAGEPLARNFHAELEQREGAIWLKSYFYWPRVPENERDTLLEKIDSGILKECSISFIYTFPECSECGRDMRSCPHEIGDGKAGDNDSITHFIYNGISQVLETSLVYKGSVKGTFLSDKLADYPIDEIKIAFNGKQLCLSIDNRRGKLSAIEIIDTGISSKTKPKLLESPDDMRVSLAGYNSSTYLLVKAN